MLNVILKEKSNWFVTFFLQGTNINDAVLRGVDMLIKDRQQKNLPERSVDMIILLTDGMPYNGECAHTVLPAVYLCECTFNLFVVPVRLKERFIYRPFRPMFILPWEETCLCSVSDLETMWITPFWMWWANKTREWPAEFSRVQMPPFNFRWSLHAVIIFPSQFLHHIKLNSKYTSYWYELLQEWVLKPAVEFHYRTFSSR